jgi:hypothetical protein
MNIKNIIARIFGAKGTVSINGHSYKGNDITVDANGVIMVDGVRVGDSIQGAVNITVQGDCYKAESVHGDVSVAGNAGTAKTVHGDVRVGGNVDGDVINTQGDITCGNVGGNVRTVHGDINHN